MLDINGQAIVEGGAALLLCEVLEIQPGCIRLRVMNSEMELAVGAKHDEVLGGMVADSELTALVEENAPTRVQTKGEADGVAISRFE
jgi:hypothetical protein